MVSLEYLPGNVTPHARARRKVRWSHHGPRPREHPRRSAARKAGVARKTLGGTGARIEQPGGGSPARGSRHGKNPGDDSRDQSPAESLRLDTETARDDRAIRARYRASPGNLSRLSQLARTERSRGAACRLARIP